MLLESIILALCCAVLFMARNLWFNYRVVGQVLDLLGHPGVQDRLFQDGRHDEALNKTVSQYLFITRYAPMLIVGTLVVIVIMYMNLSSGGVSVAGTAAGALIIAAVMTWLINFNPAPMWLYRWYLVVLLTKARIDLEVIQETNHALTERVAAATDLTAVEVEFFRGQLQLVEDALRTTQSTIDMLEQQQRELP